MAGTSKMVAVDEKLGQEASLILRGMGLTLEDAINHLLKRIVSDRCLPFAMHLPNADTVEAMTELDLGKGVAFSSIEALFAEVRR